MWADGERESRMEALRKETKNRRNKEKERAAEDEERGGSESRFPLAIETATEPERERRKEGRREEEIVGVPKMAPRGEAAVGGRRGEERRRERGHAGTGRRWVVG